MVSHHRITQPNRPMHRRWDTDVTEATTFDQFSDSTESAYGRSHPFATDRQVLTAPELDDLNDLEDESPRLLIAPDSPPRAARPTTRQPADRAIAAAQGRVTGPPATSTGTHRAPRTARPGASTAVAAVHSRLLVAAIAAGAVAAGANAALDASQDRADPVVLADATAPQGDFPRMGPESKSSPSQAPSTPSCTTRNSPTPRPSPRSAPSEKHDYDVRNSSSPPEAS